MIIWENAGLVPVEAFTTFGINVKPNTENPIGHFGTGLKYAVAVTLRLGGRFRLIRADVEYEFYTKREDFRGKEFDWVRMRKKSSWAKRWSYHKLPFTTELGKEWEPWMVVRELESNCRDEGGYSIWVADGTDNDSMIVGGENTTAIIVEQEDIEYEHSKLDEIFLPKERLNLLAEVDGIEIYDSPSDFIWFRGLRVAAPGKKSIFTYNFTSGVELTEDRTLKHYYLNRIQIRNALMRTNNPDIVERLMDAKEDAFEHELDFDQTTYTQPSQTFLANLGERMTSGGVVPARMKSFYRAYYPEPNPDELVSIELRASEWRKIVDTLGPDTELAKLISNEITEQEVPF